MWVQNELEYMNANKYSQKKKNNKLSGRTYGGANMTKLVMLCLNRLM